LATRFAHLQDLLASCRSTDIHRLRKRLSQLERRAESGQPFDRMEGQIKQQLEDSANAVEKLRQQAQQVRYPDLPVVSRKEEIAEAIRDNQVVVVAGETGSGKTTQLPKICLELGLGCRGLIGHTQPRRLAARTVAARIAEELDTELGERVGFQVRFTDQVSDRSQIKLMTDGILLAETQHDRFLEKYEVLIIDEAHERSLNIDFLLGYIKQILPRRPDLKVIITSATIDLEKFSNHFNKAPVIQVSGRTYPVEVLYRPLTGDEDGEKDLDQQQGILAALDEIDQLERAGQQPRNGDVLVFLAGERDIRETADKLRKAQLRDIEVVPLYARLSLAEQNKVFSGKRQAGRRVVLATNVAETSLTVPGIRYVIDPGVARISRYSYRSKVQRLPIEPVSQASANQRKGRCGRVAEGVCIRLYSEDDFNSRPEFTDAEIRRTNLAAVILQMLSLRLGDIELFPFIDAPDSRFINDGFKLLQELRALDQKRQLTGIGRQMCRLPVDPRIGRMVIEGHKQKSLSEMLIVASALSVQDPRERPHDKKQAADQKHAEYADKESDFVTLVNLWNLLEEQRQELSQSQFRKYCQKNFLSFIRIREWRDTHRQLHLMCKQLDLAENSEPASYEAIHKAILAGYLSQIGFKQEQKEYLGARNRRFLLFPASGIYKKAPKWVVSAEIVETSQVFARMNAQIQPEWAEQLAPHLIKKTWLEPHWEKKRAQVVATEQVTLYGLIIIPKRKVNYGKVEPVISHEIFIRAALVEGEFQTKGKFFQHNRQLLASVEALEARSRRRDLLVDEDQLFDFYAGRIAELDGAQVVNGAGFEHWRQKVESKNPKALYMLPEDILQRSADHITKADYPDRLQLDGVALKLSYHFEPGAKDDGVTLHLPVALLNSVSLARLEWLVPGMLAEKCQLLLKGLPKQLRKNFVPIPDYVAAFCEKVVFGEGELSEALALHLKRMTGVAITADDFKQVQLDGHQLFNIRLLDEKGKTIAQERNWEQLHGRYGDRAEQALKQGPGDSWGRKGITSWDIDELTESVEIRQAGGIKVEAYPSLVDCGDSVELKVELIKVQADQQSRQGIARLLMLDLTEQVRFCRKQLTQINEALIYGGTGYQRRALEDEILLQSIMQLIDQRESLPRAAEEYKQCREWVKSSLFETANNVAALVLDNHKLLHELKKKLSGRVALETVTVLNDIKAQLEHLIYSGYLLDVRWEWLQHYPRYLKAISVRLEKYQRTLAKERLLSDQLRQCWQQYRQKRKQQDKKGIYDADLDLYRWMLEEYRVSLFAQQLGTQVPVSEKRLRQQWQRVAA